MGLIIRERVKLTFFGLGFVHFIVLPCVSFNFDLLVQASAESKNLSSRQIVKNYLLYTMCKRNFSRM